MKALRILVTGMACMGGFSTAHGQVKPPATPKAERPTPASPLEPGAKQISSGIARFNLLSKVDATYPEDARSQNIQGDVVVHILIGKDGAVAKAVIFSGPKTLRQAAFDAVKQYKYKPFLTNGEPVDVDTKVIVAFKLDNPPATP
jgi:protein TonB